MVYKPYDPLDDLLGGNPYASILRQPSAPRRAPAFPSLPEEQEESVLSSVTNKALGGLGYLGQVLDKPGRSIRGLLAGKPRELLNIIPFAEAAGLTRPEDYTFGRDLLEQAGILGANEEGLDWGDVAGFGVDVVTDPLSWLTFGSGAVNQLGQAAKRAGVLPKTVRGRLAGLAEGSDELAKLAAHTGRPASELAGQSLGGLVGTGGLSNLVGLGGATFLEGRAGEAALDALGGLASSGRNLPGVKQVLDSGAAQAVGRGLGSAWTGLKGLFHAPTGGAYHPGLQQVHEDVVLKHLGEGVPAVREAHAQALRSAQEAGYLGGDAEEMIRRAVEGSLPMGPYTPAQQAAIDASGRFAKALEDTLAQERALGIDTALLDNYFPRYADLTGEPSVMNRKKFLQAHHVSQTGREAMFQGPYRQLDTETIEQILHDQVATGIRGTPLEQHTTRGRIMDYLAQGRQLTPGTPEYQAAFQQAEQIANWASRIGTLDPAKRFFGSPLENFARRQAHSAKARAAAEGIHEFLRQNLRPLTDTSEELVPLSLDNFKQLGLGATEVIPEGEIPAALRALSERSGIPLDQLRQMGVPKDVFAAATRYMTPLVAPEAAQPFIAALDGMTNLFKGLVTVPFPGFHVRNFITGGWQNWVGGATDPTTVGPMAMIRPFMDADKLAKGQTIEGISKAPIFQRLGITDDAAATRQLADWMYAYELGGAKGLSQREAAITGRFGEEAMETLGKDIPGQPGWVPIPSKNPLDWYVPRTAAEANPLNIAGVGTTESVFRPVAQGDIAARYVDFLNRGSAFIAYLKQGYEPQAAAAASKALHYDYKFLTPFEKSFMRRLIPFYGWSRKNAEFVISTLLTNPAIEAGAIRAATSLRDQDTFVPGWIGEGFSVPLPGAPQGQQRYLSGLGLPIEDETMKAVGSLLRGDISRAGGQLASQVHPALKMPAEEIMGKQFYTGRSLDELRPSGVGSAFGLLSDEYARPISQIVANTPLSRFASTIDKLLDVTPLGAIKDVPEEKRKDLPQTTLGGRKDVLETALNLLSGARVTDVDLERAKEIAASRIIQDLLQGREGVKLYTRPYARADQIDHLDPESILLLRLQTGLDKRRRERANQEKAK